MKKVSVVVPVYNSEKEVINTIESLLNQSLKEIEIILVNDGSTDNSLDVLNKYQKDYGDKIVVLDIENSGPGGARNAGISVASGEYIGFLDSDDTNLCTMYEEMYNKAKSGNYDMVVCDVNGIYPKENIIIKSGVDKDTNDEESIKKAMIFSYTVVWNRIIKSNIVKKIKFSDRLWYEDVEYLYKLFPEIKSIGVINKAFSNYIQNDNSITYTFNNKIYDIVTVMDNILSYYKKNNLYEKYYDELEYSYVRYMYGTFVRRMAKTKNKREYKAAVNKAIKKVKENFPEYKKNKYICQRSGKNVYLKLFGNFVAKLTYYVEKNKMNYKLQNAIEKIIKKS